MDPIAGLGDLLTVKALAPKAPAPWSSDPQPRNAFSLPSAATTLRPPRSRSKEVFSSKSKGFSCDAAARPPLPSLGGSLPRRILPGRFISSLEYTSSEVEHVEQHALPGPSIEGAFPVGPATAWGSEAGTAGTPSQGRRDTTISLPGDAFSFAEAVDSPEDGLSESASDFLEEVVVEELEEGDDAVEGDDEEEDENPAETEAEDNVEEGDLDFAKDSDSDQPGSTQEDVAGCEEATEAEATAVEELLMINGTEPVIIITKKKKKRKKKRKKKQKVTTIEEVTVEKKPPVPRFPHPSQSKEDVSCVGAAMERSLSSGPSERIPLRERFAKHLLFGRFAKRRPEPGGAAAAEATEEDEDKPAPVEDGGTSSAVGEEATSEDQAASLRRRSTLPSSAAAQRAARARARALRPPRVVRIKRILKEPRPLDVREESEKATETDGEAKGSPGPSSLGLVARAIRLRREPPPPKTVWKEPAVETLLSLGSLYFSFSSMRTAEGKKVPLKNRDKVVRTLHELNTKVALPICRQFGLRYNFFSEHHPQAKKAGVTCKEPLILRKQGPDGTEIQETRYLVTIRLRLRLHPTKGDPQTDFISHGTQIAVLLHELCHLKHMNHGKDFMLFLRDIFAFAHKTLGVFDAGETNEIPSPWPWENVIFQRAGDVSNDELLRLFAEHREKQHQAKTPPKTPEPEPSHPDHFEESSEVVAVEAPSEVPRMPADMEVLPDVPEDIEAVSTSASDDALASPRREDGIAGIAKTKGASLNLVAAFQSTKGHATSCDCCQTEMAAYGEETPMNGQWLSGEDAPPPPPAAPWVRLPPLTPAAFRGSPSVHASPKPKAPGRLPPLA